jgi:hypothetical protein
VRLFRHRLLRRLRNLTRDRSGWSRRLPEAGMSSLEMAVLAAGLLAMATAVVLALQGKLDHLMSTFTST